MLPQKSLMLQKATSALSCVFLGKIHRDQPVLQYGIGLYNEAIHEMSKTLNRKDYNPDMIYTCALFEQIEVRNIYITSQDKDYLQAIDPLLSRLS